MKKNVYLLIFSAILAISLFACGAPDEPEVTEPTDEEKMEQLLDLIETKVSEYDGCTVSHDSGTINVNVWKESITGTANSVLTQGGGSKDETWEQAKADVENTVIHIADCIRSSDFASTKLLLNVLDHSDHGRKLLTFNNSGVAYDIVAEASVPSQEEQPYKTEQSTQPKTDSSTKPDEGSGGQNNFNTYDNPEQQQTNAAYVLNTSTMVFHVPSCRMVSRISPENYSTHNGTRNDVIGMGYSACGICNP